MKLILDKFVNLYLETKLENVFVLFNVIHLVYSIKNSSTKKHN